MFKYITVAFIIVLVVVTTLVIFLLKDQVSVQSRAENRECAQSFPDEMRCAAGQEVTLVEGNNGCYEFVCQ